MIEFSDRLELYRRGILKPPEPRAIELSAQIMTSSELTKPVRLRWRSPKTHPRRHLPRSLLDGTHRQRPRSCSQSFTIS